MGDLPVSFSWISPKSSSSSNFVTYCFAYIRDPKTYDILYAGVKYEGLFSYLKSYKSSLRKTAVERLLRRPIYANFSLGDDESYKNKLKDPKFKFNGIGLNDEIKKTNSLGKFFIYCALNQEFSNLGIFTKKSGTDVKFIYKNNRYEVTTNNSDKNIVHLKFGYQYDGNEMKRIINGHLLMQNIYNLRRNAKFYGKKVRYSFENYGEIDSETLASFGISQKCNKEIEQKFRDYVMDNRVIFFRHKLSNNTQAHIAVMEFHNWAKFVSEVYGKDMIFNINGLLFNTYCMGFTIERYYRTKREKLLYRKIAIDRMIDRPNIIDGDFFENQEIKEIRTWFAKRLGYFSEEGIGRINYQSEEVDLTGSYIRLTRYDEVIRVYDNNRNYESFLESLFKFTFYPVRYFFRLFWK